MSHVRVWQFRPPAGREREFAAAYCASGPWAELFARSPGYVGTILLEPSAPGGWWLTLDRWRNRADFERFSGDFGEEYRALDSRLEGVAGEELFVGAFEDADQNGK